MNTKLRLTYWWRFRGRGLVTAPCPRWAANAIPSFRLNPSFWSKSSSCYIEMEIALTQRSNASTKIHFIRHDFDTDDDADTFPSLEKFMRDP